jgi:transcriptional regulator with XRE-family HTH domain
LGAELRAHREAENLTLQALGARIRYSTQHISQIEHGRATATETFVRACDAELGTDGALMRLLPDVILEHHKIRSARVAARRGAELYSEPQRARA